MGFLFLFLSQAFSADHSKYRTCEQSRFCSRDRFASEQNWNLNPKSIKFSGNNFDAQINDVVYNTVLDLKIRFLACGAARLRIEPNNKESFPRFDASSEPTIVHPSELSSTIKYTQTQNSTHVVLTSDFQSLEIQFAPFVVHVINKNGQRRLTINADNTAVFETSRDKEKYPELFESHNWGGHTDQFPNGPTSVALDIDFISPKTRLSALPSHTLPLSLQNTISDDSNPITDPIRLFTTDINSYEVNSVMAMYGAIPFIFAHSLDGNDGVFWCNPSETWVDISSIKGEGKRARLMSEGGYIDLFISSGQPSDITNTFTQITGRPQLLPYFGLAFHQCRWGYLTADEVREVDEKLDAIHLPHDVLWLDLDHTDNRKYFTFHSTNFKDPHKLLDHLDKNRRQLVVLNDPHLRAEDSYNIYSEAKNKKYLIRNADGNGEFVGNCWPGRSVWPDFLMPEVREWWASNFQYNKFTTSKPNLHIWNDMNEIAVFDSVDLTAPKDLKHVGDLEEREVHNIYGLLMVSATFTGMVRRNKDMNQRPFILTRSYFAGTQRYAAIWTGDNTGNWEHLSNSLQMVLSNGISGQVYVGADIGGFFENPDEKLLSRWYQVGAWTYSFFRTHCHHLSNYREIYNLHDDYFNVAHEAVLDRYKLLPFWYTLARQSNLTGSPIVRPLWWLFGNQEKFLDTDDKVMIGDALLVAPFLKEEDADLIVDLPAGPRWYCYKTLNEIKGETVTIPFNNGRTPVFVKGGSIVPTKSRVRKSSPLMFYDPFRLLIAVDENNKAEGELYVDDGQTFDFVKTHGNIHKRLTFDGQKLSAFDAFAGNDNNDFVKNYDVVIEQVKIVGLSKTPSKVLAADGTELEFDAVDGVVTVHRPQLLVRDNFEIKFEF
ncbi:Neutral alpha-glucosidase AB [Tritrichomonas foetus]|uniref:Neutral alpha-glucosidase AB n=1 Tax=Tritrichomonas foetus TaxID=1144522 RepID=A0A1J4JEA0_9EUKA|nr:Neutral alpha-glucosidase AB [Tritrichomonas foetus]|eukprot:OHS97526.1 Neutral alpha-glucosidase AB [Tritrichomonas foetus]